MYNLRVTRSLLKQVYIAEKLAPPTNLQVIMNAYKTMWANATNPSYWLNTVPAGDWRKLVVYGVEALGFFSIGEIVRRRALAQLTYRSASAASSATASTRRATPTISV